MRFILEDKAARILEKRELRKTRQTAKMSRRSARRRKMALQYLAGAVT